jgi:hypothetical protein
MPKVFFTSGEKTKVSMEIYDLQIYIRNVFVECQRICNLRKLLIRPSQVRELSLLNELKTNI